jgi:predicted nucleic acid-binding protein
MKFLFDASSVIEVIRSFDESKALGLLADNSILDLTKYEVGNALWKELVLTKTIAEGEFREFLDLLGRILLRTRVLVLAPENLPEVAEIAAKERMTFYDASYVTLAKIGALTLITEDEQLAKTASKHTKTATSKVIETGEHKPQPA